MDGKEIKRHINWDYYPVREDQVSGEEANKIIDDIMNLLKEKNLTIKIATQILEDTKNAVWNEALLKEYI